MNKKLLGKTLIASICMLFLSNGAKAQTQYSFQYEVTIAEIQSEESAKELDGYLRPIFDVPATFILEGKKLIFETNARIEEVQVSEKLTNFGLHVTSFAKNEIQ